MHRNDQNGSRNDQNVVAPLEMIRMLGSGSFANIYPLPTCTGAAVVATRSFSIRSQLPLPRYVEKATCKAAVDERNVATSVDFNTRTSVLTVRIKARGSRMRPNEIALAGGGSIQCAALRPEPALEMPMLTGAWKGTGTQTADSLQAENSRYAGTTI